MTAGSIAVPTIIPLRPPVPGKPKHIIDSNTRIEIKSESMNVEIYYTIDGNRPQPFAPLGTDQSTFKYRGPFTLPEGKQTVKAMATSRDGIRQSNTNTKVFEVEYIENQVLFTIEDDDKAFQKELSRNQKKTGSPHRRAWNEDSVKQLEAEMTDISVRGNTRHYGHDSARFTSSRYSQRYHPQELENGGSPQAQPRRSAPDPYKQTMKLQRKTDFLRCIYCFADRPSDPYARFCQTCGNPVPPLPNHRLAPPDPGEMGRCYYCNSTVPLNTDTCIVCEASIPVQNKPQMSLKVAESKVCQHCGTGNPANISVCLLCEAALPAKGKPVETAHFAPPLPSSTANERECSQCHRINNPDARFCDWCGAKPSPHGVPMTCSRCGASNNQYAAFCASCGVSFSAPSRGTNAHWAPVPNRNQSSEQQASSSALSKIKPAILVSSSTQTVGLYYPSERELQRKRQEEEERMAIEREMRDRKPLLTSVSPGKGYWRKQLEHVTLHLKAEGQNNTEFRALIGEPRMGKLTAVSVNDDGFELTLTASFALRGVKEPFKPSALTGSKVLSDLTQRRRNMDSESSEESDERDSIAPSEDNEIPVEKPKKKSTKKKAGKKEPQFSPEDRKLLQEVGKKGHGRGNEILELITEGASPLVCTPQGTPALVLATVNKHIDCLPVLLDSGADVNAQDKNGNTALHEAVNCGYEGKEMMDILLSHGPSLVIKNNKGQTPHDLAVRIGNNTAIKTLMTSLGQANLDKISKPGKVVGKGSSKLNLF